MCRPGRRLLGDVEAGTVDRCSYVVLEAGLGGAGHFHFDPAGFGVGLGALDTVDSLDGVGHGVLAPGTGHPLDVEFKRLHRYVVASGVGGLSFVGPWDWRDVLSATTVISREKSNQPVVALQDVRPDGFDGLGPLAFEDRKDGLDGVTVLL